MFTYSFSYVKPIAIIAYQLARLNLSVDKDKFSLMIKKATGGKSWKNEKKSQFCILV